MATVPCATCGGTRWVCYLTETIDGDFEEALRLCECNFELQEGRGSGPRQTLDQAEITLTAARLRVVAHGVTFEISVESNPGVKAANHG